MEIRNLGKSGLRVSVVGLGGNNFGGRIDTEQTRKVVYKALDVGITLIDTADIYAMRGNSEIALGEVLGDRRKDMVLATKFGLKMSDDGVKSGGARRYIVRAVEDSLRRLKTDYIDLYQIHTPDPLTPQEETLRALDDLVRSGKVLYIGCSNHRAWSVVESEWISKSEGLERYISCQDQYSLLKRDVESELVPAMVQYGIGMLPYFPLASGLLSGKHHRNAPQVEGSRLSGQTAFTSIFLTDRNWEITEKLESFAQERGHTLLELAFSWLACRPTVGSIIAGATKIEQVEANAKAAEWKLTPEEMAEIDKIAPPPPPPGH